MELRRAEEYRLSWWARGRYLAAWGLLASIIAVPGLFVPAYTTLVATCLVLVAVTCGLWLVVSATLTLRTDGSNPQPTAPLPHVSVVVTALDEADVLAGTIDACRNLTYPADKLEIVVCYEHTSTDGTAALAEAAERTDSRVRAICRDSPPAGKAAAANTGLEAATGDVIALLDADQRLEPPSLRRAVAHLQLPGVDCVTGRRYGTNPGESVLALYATVEHHLAERVEFPSRTGPNRFGLFTGGQVFFDGSVFSTLGRFDESVLLEDLEMACRIQAAGGEVRVDPGIRSYERNPATFGAWWHQRVRWARGGMQVARTSVPALLRNSAVPLTKRLDALVTVGGLIATPLCVLIAPTGLMGLGGDLTVSFFPTWWPAPLALALVGVPLLVSLGVVLADRRAGRNHDWRELLAAASIPAYAALQACAILQAFFDEFLLRRPSVYVTS